MLANIIRLLISMELRLLVKRRQVLLRADHRVFGVARSLPYWLDIFRRQVAHSEGIEVGCRSHNAQIFSL